MPFELRKRLFARCYDRVAGGYEERMGQRKRELFAQLRGTVVEIGPGTGVLAEIRRVLRPGGRFVFWEHVAAPEGTKMRIFQRRLSPLWRLWADGCRLDRDTGRSIQSAGFAQVELEEFSAPKDVCPHWVAPHVAGHAVR